MSFDAKSSDNEAGEGDDESSSLQENVLANFREQWQQELEVSSKSDVNEQFKNLQINNTKTEETESVEQKAKRLFLQGSENERSGKLYEAIQFYKRAVQLVPDIEFRLYESTKINNNSNSGKKETEENDNYLANDFVIAEKDQDISENVDESDIFEKLSKIVQKTGFICLPRDDLSLTHISALPMEIFLYILRWVVSSELDTKSLETLSTVSRGFYVCARDPEIWKMACIKVWGVNCGNCEPTYKSWREMYFNRPRLRYNGCYISKTSYIRPGENSFQDQFYKPWHLVEYYRYLRFFPEGICLMLTSTDDAQSCVTSLKTRTPRNVSVMIGYYRLHESRVTLVMKRQENKNSSVVLNNNRRRKRCEIIHDSGEQTFHVELEIQNYHKRRNAQLSWLCYIIYTKYNNGQEVPTHLSVGGRYPAFKFNRVKSYTQESECPL